MLSLKIKSANISHLYWNLILVVAAIFITEAVVILILSTITTHSIIIEALIDSSLLILILLPLLYFLIISPLNTKVEKLTNAEETLTKKQVELQESLNKRTEDLTKADKQAHNNMLERKKIEKELLDKVHELLHYYQIIGMGKKANEAKLSIKRILSNLSDIKKNPLCLHFNK